MGRFFKITTTVLFVTFLSFSQYAHAGKNTNQVQQIKERGYIIMGTSADFEPFEYLEPGNVTGIDVDIGNKIANRLGVKLKVTDVSLDSLVFELRTTSCDFVAAGMSYDDERAKNVDFSDPYFSASQVMVVKNNSTIASFNDLTGKKVGVQLGTTGDKYCSNNEALSGVIRFNRPTDAIMDLINGQISAIVIDDFSANKIVTTHKDKICKLDEKLTTENYSIAVLKGNSDLLAVINEVLADIKSSGELEDIISSYSNASAPPSRPYAGYGGYVIEGLKNTVIMTFFASLIGIIIGIVISSLRILAAGNKKLKLLGWFAQAYTTIIRGTPALLQLFVMYYVVLGAFGVEKIVAAIISFGINSGAYVAEHIRGGILSINKGQTEAGLSLGLSPNCTIRKIVLPQALRNIVPSLASEAITLLKETSIAGFIGIMDLSRAGDKIRSLSYEPLLPLVVVAAIYFVLVFGFTTLLSRFERRLHRNDSR